MKTLKHITTALLLLLAITVTAQQGINYKALIKDGSGNVLASSPVTIQFIIYEGAALTNNVYQESHTVNTDANGIVIVNIGQGTTSNVFANINWGIDQHFLNVQINTGAGLVDMGTTEFMAVPYALNSTNALYANNTTSANNGLTIDGNTVIDNGGGWHRSYGSTGWYNGTYGGGIYMKNSTWVEVYGNKNFLVPFGTFQVGDIGNSTFRVSGGTITMGEGTTASGTASTSMGIGTKAEAYGSTAIGAYNIGGGNPTTVVSTNPLFEVGNGTSSTRSNALTVFKNGNTDVNGILRAQNNVWPTTGAGVEIAYDPIFLAGVLPSFKFGAGYIQSYRRDLSEFRPLFLGATNVLPVNDNSFGLGNATFRWLQVYAVNGTIQTSDRRMKKEIKNINYGLNTVMKLRPVSYKWKQGNQDVNLGLIAQEVQKLLPEVVDVGDDDIKTLGMKYTELIPVLIKGMQEQQKLINSLQSTVSNQQSEIKSLTSELVENNVKQNKNLENLMKRMSHLEANNQ